MIRCFYDWILFFVVGLWVFVVFGFVFFVESLVFLILLDIFLILMVIVWCEKVWWYVLLCMLILVVGGIVGYFIGMFLFE